MTRRLFQFGILALAVAAGWALHAEEPAPVGGTGPCRLVESERVAPVSFPADDTSMPELQRPSSAPLLSALPEGRPAPLRSELRQPGLKDWLASSAAATGLPPAWWSRPGVARPTLSRVRLHVLLCTWLA
jgi:hypothetical protein